MTTVKRCLLTSILFIVCLNSIATADPPPGYTKVWEDNFDKPELDSSNWTIGTIDPDSMDLVPGAHGKYLLNTSYAGYITEDDVEVNGGSLILKNQKRDILGISPSSADLFNYSSGWVMSMHKIHFNKGYIEWRAQFPSGDKVWPALWLIAEDLVWGPEWDCFEYFGWRSDVGYDVMGQHLYTGSWHSDWISGYDGSYDCEAWHVYGFEWTATNAVWTIDGNVTRVLSSVGGWPNEEMYIVMNNGVKTDSSDTNTFWPNNLSIDYVSLYQKVSEPAVTLHADATSITESEGSVTITAVTSGTHGSDVTVNLSFGGTAEASDYTVATNAIIIPSGQTTGAVTITALQDVLIEGDEVLDVSISSVVNGNEVGTQKRKVTITDDETQVLQTWIVAGQSNAEGYGISANPVSGLTPSTTLSGIGRSDLLVTHSNVMFYQGANEFNHKSMSAGLSLPPRDIWHAMTPYEGLAYDWGSGQGNESGQRFGPELAFGFDVQEYLDCRIAIIKYARGSIPISSTGSAEQMKIWKDFDPSDGGRTNHYDRLLSAIQGAVEKLPGGIILQLRGIIWMQGESDANSSRSSSFASNLTEFISSLRSDIGVIADASEGRLTSAAANWDYLDIYIGTIQNPDQFSQDVINAQTNVAATDSHVFTVNGTTNLTLMTSDDWWGNGIHYDTAGQVELGQRFAAAVISQLSTQQVSAVHSVPYTWLQTLAWSNDLESVAYNDFDGDGYAAWQEFWSGTNPKDNESMPKIDSITFDGTKIVIRWQHDSIVAAIPPMTILSSSDLTNGIWSPAGTNTPANGTNAWTNTTSQSTFYRLAATNAP